MSHSPASTPGGPDPGRDHPTADEQPPEEGIILYIKPGYHDDKIVDAGVKNYAKDHPEFPHEGTENQWFSESQFESYPALGCEITNGILDKVLKSMDHPSELELTDIFEKLRENFNEMP